MIQVAISDENRELRYYTGEEVQKRYEQQLEKQDEDLSEGLLYEVHELVKQEEIGKKKKHLHDSVFCANIKHADQENSVGESLKVKIPHGTL